MGEGSELKNYIGLPWGGRSLTNNKLRDVKAIMFGHF